MATNEFDGAVDAIAEFFKGAAKLQSVIKDLGMDKPQPPEPPAGAVEPSPYIRAMAEDLYNFYEARVRDGGKEGLAWEDLFPSVRRLWWGVAQAADVFGKRRYGPTWTD